MNHEEKLNIVLFSGGRGTKNISAAFLLNPQISLTILVNAYDDGLSTGRLRKYIPGMLGPSDLRKNISHVMRTEDQCDRSLKKLLDFRFSLRVCHDTARAQLGGLCDVYNTSMTGELANSLRLLNLEQYDLLKKYLVSFLDYEDKLSSRGNPFDYDDCSLGNILFSGCYLCEGRDFNKTVEAFSRFCQTKAKILNVSQGENLILAGVKEDGELLRCESEIVDSQSRETIVDLFLLQKDLDKAFCNAVEPQNNRDKLRVEMEKLSYLPRLNPEAKLAIHDADIIVYGPGTQFSSLFPSYMTEGMAETIMANTSAEKVFVGNITVDHDIQSESANSLINKFFYYMSRKEEVILDRSAICNRFFINRKESASNDSDKGIQYVSYKQDSDQGFQERNMQVFLADWESRCGEHSGGRILDELLSLLEERLSKKIKFVRHTVSIIVPALNEAKTADVVLQKLHWLDFSELNLGKEIIFVDGGSNDGTFEKALLVPGIKCFQLKERLGKGAALRFGMERAHGNIIVFFPSDDEYDVGDIKKLISPIISHEFAAVFGSRMFKCVEVDERIREIYGRRYLPYFMSKYGGLTLSLMCLLLYRRYLSDPLTSLKAFDGNTLKRMYLLRNGFEMDFEIFAALWHKREYVLEVPVNFKARTREHGKKINLWDGIKCIWILVRKRFKSKL